MSNDLEITYEDYIAMEEIAMEGVHDRYETDVRKTRIYYSTLYTFFFTVSTLLVIYTRLFSLVLVPFLFWLLYKFTMKYAPRVKSSYTPYGDFD